MSVFKEQTPRIKGQTGLWLVRYTRAGERLVEPITWPLKPNQIQYDWGFVAAKTIGQGDRKFKLAAMYIEFENVASPSNPVTAPAFGRDAGTEYYDDLQSSGTKDFLRVPFVSMPVIGIESGFEPFFTPDETGNKLTFYAQTQGVTGVHGKTFSDSVNSKVYGAALVATPDFADRTQDVVFARAYYPTISQTVKEASAQIGVTWEIAFG